MPSPTPEPPSAEKLRAAAEGLAPLVLTGLLEYGEAHNALELAAIREVDDAVARSRAAYAIHCLSEAMMRPGLAASWDIRRAIGDLMSARKPRETILLAAYRAANGRLDSETVEAVVKQELAAYVHRIRDTKR